MTLAIVLVVVAVVALVGIFCVAVSRNRQLVVADRVAPKIQPIDIEAFRNLADPTEDDYLRRRLPASEFRAVRRQRLLAMAAYIRTAGTNAAVLIEIGKPALSAADAPTSEAARQLVDNAMLLRRNAAFALLRIKFALAWPGSSLAAAPILHGYERLHGSAMLLGRLQNPAAPVRIAS